MGIRDLFRRVQTKASAVGGMLWMNPGQPHWSGRDYEAFADEGYRRNVVANACVRKIMESVAMVKWTAWSGEREVTTSPFLDLLNNPNPMQSGDEYVMATVANLMIAGNRYDERVMVGSRPRELYTLRPDRMKILPGTAGFPIAYRYTVGSRHRDFPVDPGTLESDIRHDKLFNPLDDWYGMSPVEAGAYAIDQHNEGMKHLQALLQNSATPSGALQVEGDLSDDQFKRLKADIEEKYSGTRNAGRPMLLEGGMKWVQMGFSPSDMQALELKYSSARDVCLAFGVPPLLINIQGDNTYSNYAEARLAFWEDTVIPLVDRLAQDWTKWLGPYFSNQEIRPDLDQIPAIADKRKTLWDMADKATDLTVNERRELKGYPPIEGGDVLLVSANQIGLNDALAMGGADDDDDNDDDTRDMEQEAMKRIAYGPDWGKH